MTSVGNRIRLAREALLLSQSALADQVGVDQTTISSWERDVTVPGLAAAADLIRLLGLTWSDFDPHRIAS